MERDQFGRGCGLRGEKTRGDKTHIFNQPPVKQPSYSDFRICPLVVLCNCLLTCLCKRSDIIFEFCPHYIYGSHHVLPILPPKQPPPPSLVISSLLSHHFTRGHSLCSTALMQLFVFRLKHFTFIYSVHCFFFLFYYFSEWPCQSTHQIRSLLLTPVNSSKCPWNKAQI